MCEKCLTSFNPRTGIGIQEGKTPSRLVTLLFSILLSLTLVESSAVESRKRKRKEISCYPLAEFIILTLDVVPLSRYVIRNQNNLDPEGSWRYVK